MGSIRSIMKTGGFVLISLCVLIDQTWQVSHSSITTGHRSSGYHSSPDPVPPPPSTSYGSSVPSPAPQPSSYNPTPAPAPKKSCKQVPKQVCNQDRKRGYPRVTRQQCHDVQDTVCGDAQERTCQITWGPVRDYATQMVCSFHYKKDCDTVNDVQKQCTQITDEECYNAAKLQCVSLPKNVQETVHEEQCTTEYDKECSTRYENKCEPVYENEPPAILEAKRVTIWVKFIGPSTSSSMAWASPPPIFLPWAAKLPEGLKKREDHPCQY